MTTHDITTQNDLIMYLQHIQFKIEVLVIRLRKDKIDESLCKNDVYQCNKHIESALHEIGLAIGFAKGRDAEFLDELEILLEARERAVELSNHFLWFEEKLPHLFFAECLTFNAIERKIERLDQELNKPRILTTTTT
jgi:hypothetical protein